MARDTHSYRHAGIILESFLQKCDHILQIAELHFIILIYMSIWPYKLL